MWRARLRASRKWPARLSIYWIVATQTPRADVITANTPSQIAFQVASKIDNQVILDENGADRLLGQGENR